MREASPRREGRLKVGGLTPGPGKGVGESILGGGTTTCKVHAGKKGGALRKLIGEHRG